jgi:hypothetical protein
VGLHVLQPQGNVRATVTIQSRGAFSLVAVWRESRSLPRGRQCVVCVATGGSQKPERIRSSSNE